MANKSRKESKPTKAHSVRFFLKLKDPPDGSLKNKWLAHAAIQQNNFI
ncbi:hypothetical protein [Arachidicoccus rhizosphaerae]|nr:hypothetical protein [Arachidicoccus rhizosphaerae]